MQFVTLSKTIHYQIIFLGKNGTIVFTDGTVYGFDVKTKGGLIMRFMDGENEILRYATESENKKNAFNFSVGGAKIGTEKLLILAAFGMILFTISFGDDGSGDDILLLTSLAAIS